MPGVAAFGAGAQPSFSAARILVTVHLPTLLPPKTARGRKPSPPKTIRPTRLRHGVDEQKLPLESVDVLSAAEQLLGRLRTGAVVGEQSGLLIKRVQGRRSRSPRLPAVPRPSPF